MVLDERKVAPHDTDPERPRPSGRRTNWTDASQQEKNTGFHTFQAARALVSSDKDRFLALSRQKARRNCLRVQLTDLYHGVLEAYTYISIVDGRDIVLDRRVGGSPLSSCSDFVASTVPAMERMGRAMHFLTTAATMVKPRTQRVELTDDYCLHCLMTEEKRHDKVEGANRF